MSAIAKSPPEEWVLELEKRIRRLRISKRKLAKSLNLNYSTVCNVSTGYINRPDILEQILTKLEEMEAEV